MIQEKHKRRAIYPGDWTKEEANSVDGAKKGQFFDVYVKKIDPIQKRWLMYRKAIRAL